MIGRTIFSWPSSSRRIIRLEYKSSQCDFVLFLAKARQELKWADGKILKAALDMEVKNILNNKKEIFGQLRF